MKSSKIILWLVVAGVVVGALYFLNLLPFSLPTDVVPEELKGLQSEIDKTELDNLDSEFETLDQDIEKL